MGKGLSALLGGSGKASAKPAEEDAVLQIDIAKLFPSPFQPRRVFSEEGLNDLVTSIKEKGVLQPLMVRKSTGDDKYEIIAGERRWRAAQIVGLRSLPVFIKELTDQEALEVALIENLQRQDLTALEEAEGYRRLMIEFNHTQEELAQVVGKSRSHVGNMLRLLTLSDKIKDMMDQGKLSAGHARALLNAHEPEKLAEKVVKRGLSVRQTEKLASTEGQKQGRRPLLRKMNKSDDVLHLEQEIGNLIGLRTEIKMKDDKGVLAIHYNSLDQLYQLMNRIGTGGVIAGEEEDVLPLEADDIVSRQ